LRDIETIETELLLADLQTAEGALDKLRRTAKQGDKDAILRVEVLDRCHKALADGKPVRSLSLDIPDHIKIVRGTGLMTAKRVLYVANVDESDLHGEGPLVTKIRDYAAKHDGRVVPVCAKIESELSELGEADRTEMLASLGMTEPALASVARAAYELLKLQSFYTAGPKEIRAWTIPAGATAPQAAGVIHTDFEKGFIRVEVYQVEDLVKYTSEAAIKAAGKLRLEGKPYVMRNGDVCHFLFNV